MKNIAKTFLMIVAILSLSACSYNQFQSKDEAVNAAWAEVLNQYQRRADLIPNLVNTVKGYTQHENDTLLSVTRARAAATSFQITPEVLNNPEAFRKFQQLQGRTEFSLVQTDGHFGKLSQSESGYQFQGSASPAGRHGKPDSRRAPAIYPVSPITMCWFVVFLRI